MEPSSELREKLLALYDAMSSGDADAVEAFYSLEAGGVFVGTDASEFWTDAHQHNADVRPFFDGAYGRFEFRADNPLALTEGTVGWTIDRPSIRLPDGSTLATRLTLVWRREDGTWRVVHSHISMGANQA